MLRFMSKAAPVAVAKKRIDKLEIVKDGNVNVMELINKVLEYLKSDPESGGTISEFLGDIIPLLKMITEAADPNNTDPPELIQNKLVAHFILIAKKYIPLEIRNPRQGRECPRCFFYTEEVTTNDEGMLVCRQCGSIISSFNHKAINHNYVTEHGVSNSVNAAKKQFEEEMDELMARHRVTVDFDTLFPKLDEYFRRRNLDTSEVVKAKPLVNGIRGSYTIKDLRTALKECGYKHYKNDILIAQYYWDWQPPDFSHLRPKLLELFDIVQPIYDRVKTQLGRKSTNGRIRLYYYLRSLGFSINPKMLFLIDVETTLDEYDVLFTRVTREVRKIPALKDWPFITIPRM